MPIHKPKSPDEKRALKAANQALNPPPQTEHSPQLTAVLAIIGCVMAAVISLDNNPEINIIKSHGIAGTQAASEVTNGNGITSYSHCHRSNEISAHTTMPVISVPEGSVISGQPEGETGSGEDLSDLTEDRTIQGRLVVISNPRLSKHLCLDTNSPTILTRSTTKADCSVNLYGAKAQLTCKSNQVAPLVQSR